MRLRRWLIRIALLGVLAWATLFGVEYFAFAGERALDRWTWPEPAAQVATPAAPRYEAKPGSRQILFLEHDLLAPDSQSLSARTRELTGALSGSPVPVRADLVWLPASTTVRAAAWLANVNGKALVVVTISARDVVWNHRTTIAGVAQPEIRDQDGTLTITPRAATPPPETGLEQLLRDVPTVRMLIDRPALLPSESGRFPVDLWPYRRGGTQDEDKRYRATELALKHLRASVVRGAGQLVVLYLPCGLEVGRSSRGRCQAALGLTSREIESARVRRRLEDITGQVGIAWVDPTLALEKAGRSRGELYDNESSLAAPLTARARSIVMRRLGKELTPLLRD